MLAARRFAILLPARWLSSSSAAAGGAAGSADSSPPVRDGDWLHSVVEGAKLAEAGPVRGTMVLRPAGMALWDGIRSLLDERIRATGHHNAYFPSLIPASFLQREAAHVAGFSAECAVVTHSRLRVTSDSGGKAEPDPAAKLDEPLVIRPTSETVIWNCYSKWIESHRDLPMLINQWANIVRWELRPRLFLRTTEFLWQEGHTAHRTAEEAQEECAKMLEVYREVCEDFLAMPVIPGRKSPIERFAGAEYTLTIESIMQNGWALQCGTAHFLGEAFSKAFNVTFSDIDGVRKFPAATSWGMSTRSIGGLIMTHSDNQGLVLPPKIAPVQVVIVPIWNVAAKKDEVLAAAQKMQKSLRSAGIRVQLDDSADSPGSKFFTIEKSGTPLRIEIGPRDLSNNSAVCVTRVAFADGKRKFTVSLDGIETQVNDLLERYQKQLFDAAKQRINSQITTGSYKDLAHAMEQRQQKAFLVPWAEDDANEVQVKTETKATIRCYPFAHQHEAAGKTCFFSGRPATHMALFARAF